MFKTSNSVQKIGVMLHSKFNKGSMGIVRLAKLFCWRPSPCLTVLIPFPASLQVDIVPSQGEISVGESKFFLCQGVWWLKGLFNSECCAGSVLWAQSEPFSSGSKL